MYLDTLYYGYCLVLLCSHAQGHKGYAAVKSPNRGVRHEHFAWGFPDSITGRLKSIHNVSGVLKAARAGLCRGGKGRKRRVLTC